jgi:DNA repair protein SbcD/Mre11
MEPARQDTRAKDCRLISFLHAADLHLDSPLKMLEQYEGAPVESLRLATRRGLTRLVDLALERKVDFVLLAGDIYDGDWKDFNTGLFFVREMGRLSDARIPVVLIAGNHDAANKMTRQLRLPTGVQMLSAEMPTTILWEDLGVAVHGQSFASAAITDDLSKRYPLPTKGLFNIGLLHTCAEGREGHDRYAPCSINDLSRKGYDYWALGHIHRREVLLEDPFIVFPGNTQGRSIRETGPKGCLHVRISTTGTPEAEFVPLHVAQWEHLRVPVGPIDTMDTILERFEEILLQSIPPHPDVSLVARVTLEGNGLPDQAWPRMDEWTSEIRSLATARTDGSAWIESVRSAVSWSGKDSVDAHGHGALAAILRQIESLQSGQADLSPIQESLEAILHKLPPELQSDTSFRLDGPADIRVHLAEVTGLLTSLFREPGADSP